MTDLLDEWRRLAEAKAAFAEDDFSPEASKAFHALNSFEIHNRAALLALATRGREAEQMLDFIAAVAGMSMGLVRHKANEILQRNGREPVGLAAPMVVPAQFKAAPTEET